MLSGSEAGTLGRVGVAWRRWLTVTALLLALLCGTVGAAEEAPEPIEVEIPRTPLSPAGERPVWTWTWVSGPEGHVSVVTKREDVGDAVGAIYQVFRDLKPGPHNVLVIEGEELPPGMLADVLEELFNVPEVTYQLRVRLILAHPSGAPQSGVPRELEDLAALLSSVFTFREYELLDDAVMIAQTGSRGSMRLAGGEYQLEFMARYEPSAGAQAGEARSFAFDPFKLERRIVEEEGPDRDETEVDVLSTSFRVRSNSSIVVGASRAEAGTDVALVVVLTVSPAHELVQPFPTLDLSTPEATVRSFTKAAAAGNVGLAQACFLPGGVDYEDVREVLGADPSQADEHQFSMVMRAIDPDGPITVISRKGTSEDEVSITWRVTFKSEVSSTEGGKKVTFKQPGDTLDLDASLKKVGDRWLIDNF